MIAIHKSKGFTLIELLVVIAIIGVLLSISLPALQNLTAKGINTATAPLISTLRLARQYAITHRKYVYFAITDAGVGASGGVSPGFLQYSGDQSLMALRAYAVLEADDATSQPRYVTDWKYLPQGVYFDPLYEHYGTILTASVGVATAIFPFPNDEGLVRNMPAFQFRPNGRVYSCSGASWGTAPFGQAEVPLATAVVDIDTGNGRVVAFRKDPNTSNVVIKINYQTGQADVDDYDKP